MSTETDRLLEQLVGQFASPYDFLRELVQNAMDAQSDSIDVLLHSHRGDSPSEVIFELEIIDAGEGMDEAIIDGELTRLFGTSKVDDRTMAGGFGVGFVSIFAWEPERVVVQTGRRGEAWELLFAQDRTFEKFGVDMPIEGTTVRLFKRGVVAERVTIAQSVRDALQRWCRYCPVDISFEDVEAGEGPEVINVEAVVEGAAASVEHAVGATRCRIAYAATPRVTLMRHGIVLADGVAEELVPVLAEAAGPAVKHLDVWLDSPRLTTGIARNAVAETRDRAALETELVPLLESLRGQLLGRIEALVARQRWDPAAAEELGFLHAHLACEAWSKPWTDAALLHMATGKPVSLATVRTRARLGVVTLAMGNTGADTDPDALALRLIALRSGIPVLAGRAPEDLHWIEPLLARVGLRVLPLQHAVSRVEPRTTQTDAVGALTLNLLSAAEDGPSQIHWGSFPDADAAEQVVLGGVEAGGQGVVTGADWTGALLRGRTLWLNDAHPVVGAARRAYLQHPKTSAFALALAISQRCVPPLQLDAVVDAWEEME